MSQSPVEFAAAFERLRSRITLSAGSDDAILLLIEFWPRILQLSQNPAYSSYVAEYLSFLDASLKEEGFRDLAVNELKQLEIICTSGGADFELTSQIRKQIARLCFYVGELSEGLQACLRITNEQLKNDGNFELDPNLSEFERFRTLVDRVGDAAPNTRNILLRLLEDWQNEREFVSTGQIHSLFVQHSGMGDGPRGKLRVLTGSIEERGHHSENDEVTFDNQLRAADDPIVGVAYQALAAVRSYFKATGHPNLGSRYYHAHLTLAEREATYTGDSIGIATALLAYAQLLHTQALRHDHLLPGDVACTGGIDESGKATTVNEDSLRAKVERAFFSHIKHLVLPAANLAQAQQHHDALLVQHPARQLILLPVASLSAIVNDHNIVRPEKVCIGEFVAKKAVNYSRMTKVQVPMLLVLAYLLFCLIVPKAWVWFDWNPASVKIVGNKMGVLNLSGAEVWHKMFADSISQDRRCWTVADLDADGRNEVLFFPSKQGFWELNGLLHWFDSSGELLRITNSMVRGKYPDKSELIENPVETEACYVSTLQCNGSTVILTRLYAQMPARTYIRTWSAFGDSLGWYIFSGYAFGETVADFYSDQKDELLLYGVNNRLRAVCAFAIDPFRTIGVSPPYQDESYDLSNVISGNQKAFVIVRPSLVSKSYAPREFQEDCEFRLLSNNHFQLITNERTRQSPSCLVYQFDSNLHLVSVGMGDGFPKALQDLRNAGHLTGLTDKAILDSLYDDVTYYTDGEYTTEGQLRSTE